MLQVDRDFVRQRFSRWNTTLGNTDRPVVVSRVVEVYAVGVQRCWLVTETVVCVNSNGVILIDLNHGGTANESISAAERTTLRDDSRPCSIDTDDSTFEELVRISGSIGDVPVVVDNGSLNDACRASDGSDGGESVQPHLRGAQGKVESRKFE